MASTNLYAPSINSYIPAFVYDDIKEGEDCAYFEIPFYLSRFNTIDQVKSVHISVSKQPSGISMVKTFGKEIVDNRYRNAGIIVNTKIVSDEDGLYKVRVYAKELLTEDTKNNAAFDPGMVYKIQIRLCGIDDYDPLVESGLSEWLSKNANYFSEWSTVSLTKAIYEPEINIKFQKDKGNNDIIESTTLDINGSYKNRDLTENLYSYNLKLKYNNEIIEESGLKYSNQYERSNNQINYTFKTELIDGSKYTLYVDYETVNKYATIAEFPFTVDCPEEKDFPYELITCDSILSSLPTDVHDDTYPNTHEEVIKGKLFTGLSSIPEEEEDGFITLRIKYTREGSTEGTYMGSQICIRRTDSKTNFKKWEDIKILDAKNKKLSSFVIKDFTIESGVFYKYGIQAYEIDSSGRPIRGKLIPMEKGVLREFEHMFLLGYNGQQLKIKFNPKISSYKYNLTDTKTETIGGKYPFIVRNGAMKYRTIPIEGLICFEMDENHYFITEEELYGYKEVAESYKQYYKDRGIKMYNFTQEREFREKVLSFLLDGKPKLFKSPSEGNIIVRLMDVNCSPNQQLSRLIYNCTCNGHEIADNTIDNYKKYNLYDISQKEEV